MIEVLGFVVRVVILMLDPLTIGAAAAIAYAISYQASARIRWQLIAGAVVIMALAITAFLGRPPTAMRLMAFATSCFLQITIATEICRWLRRQRREKRTANDAA